MSVAFALTPKQLQAQEVCASDAQHIMLFGGSRSGKTFLHVRNVVMRALKAPRSRHVILRYRLSHIRSSIMMDTLPSVMRMAYPQVPWTMNKSDMFAKLGDNSEIWLGGLDDKDRTEKILGNEFATIYLNECSQIPWASREMVITRLAQKATQIMQNRAPCELKTRMLYDCNPPSKSHWTYQLFVQHVNPETKRPLPDAANYASFQLNPRDNIENLTADYLRTLEALTPRMRKRFLDGEFADATPNALFTDEIIDTWRVLDGAVPQLVRVVVAVDPSGSGDVDNAHNDAIGIVVVGVGVDGNCYVLEDCTVKAGPATWGNVVASAFDRHGADVVVGESNFGGDMVRHVIQTARPATPYQAVHASRGKAVRADPVSALYEKGKVRHVGAFRELEDELTAFSTVGYLGDGSPNRADALVWGVTSLFPSATQKPDEPKAVPLPSVNYYGRRAA